MPLEEELWELQAKSLEWSKNARSFEENVRMYRCIRIELKELCNRLPTIELSQRRDFGISYPIVKELIHTAFCMVVPNDQGWTSLELDMWEDWRKSQTP